jgi:hypothetical protein
MQLFCGSGVPSTTRSGQWRFDHGADELVGGVADESAGRCRFSVLRVEVVIHLLTLRLVYDAGNFRERSRATLAVGTQLVGMATR